MGQSTDAMLMYGYNIGGQDEWNVQEVDEWGSLTVDWYENDFQGEAEALLLAKVGFTETEYTKGYYDRKRAAEGLVKVKFEVHCSDSYPELVLAAHVITARRGYPELIDMSQLATHPSIAEWDLSLRQALETLGLTPTQPEPYWILASYWG